MADPKKPDRKAPANPYVTGPTKILDVSSSGAASRGGGEGTRPGVRPELVTDGMKAHRREIEKRKRQASIEKMHLEMQVADERKAIWKWTFRVVLVLVILFAYRKMQDAYGNQWPMWETWIVLAVVLFVGIGWLLWYLNKTEL